MAVGIYNGVGFTLKGNHNSAYESYGNLWIVDNSTVSHNMPDGIDNYGRLIVKNSTIAENAIHGINNSGGTVTVRNSTV